MNNFNNMRRNGRGACGFGEGAGNRNGNGNGCCGTGGPSGQGGQRNGMGRRKGCCEAGQETGPFGNGMGRGKNGGMGGGMGGGGSCRYGDGERRGSGRRGRLLNHGDLRLIVLSLIAERPRHGYDIIKAVEEKLGGAYAPSPGVIYPTLTMLEELGHVSVTTEDNKKSYTLTPEGRGYLDVHKASVEQLETKMGTICKAFGQGPSPEIVRAMENLRLALHLRMTKGPMEADKARDVANALDTVALLIERES